jgi:hypothetical protein
MLSAHTILHAVEAIYRRLIKFRMWLQNTAPQRLAFVLLLARGGAGSSLSAAGGPLPPLPSPGLVWWSGRCIDAAKAAAFVPSSSALPKPAASAICALSFLSGLPFALPLPLSLRLPLPTSLALLPLPTSLPLSLPVALRLPLSLALLLLLLLLLPLPTSLPLALPNPLLLPLPASLPLALPTPLLLPLPVTLLLASSLALLLPLTLPRLLPPLPLPPLPLPPPLHRLALAAPLLCAAVTPSSSGHCRCRVRDCCLAICVTLARTILLHHLCGVLQPAEKSKKASRVSMASVASMASVVLLVLLPIIHLLSFFLKRSSAAPPPAHLLDAASRFCLYDCFTKS